MNKSNSALKHSFNSNPDNTPDDNANNREYEQKITTVILFDEQG